MSKNTVVIKSIGNANPIVAKVLAESFDVNLMLLTKMIYNAPFIFLDNVDEVIANKAFKLLSQLEIDSQIYNYNEFFQPEHEALDIAVYINNPYQLINVSKELAQFLGCNEQEATNMLLTEPSVVLGGVSFATAEVLQKRINAEVIATNPQKDLYTLIIDSKDKILYKEISNYINNCKLKFVNNNTVENLTFEQSQYLWKKFNTTKKLYLYNQSFQRHEIDLVNFDLNNKISTDFLINEIGMPSESLQVIHSQLPVKIDESLNVKHANEKINIYKSKGLTCHLNPIPFGKFKIKVNNLNNHNEVEKIINQFYKNEKLNHDENKWIAPLPLESILNRYLEKQLTHIGCDVEFEFA